MMPHQCDMSDSGLTYHYQIWAAEMGMGKTFGRSEGDREERRVVLVVGRS